MGYEILRRFRFKAGNRLATAGGGFGHIWRHSGKPKIRDRQSAGIDSPWTIQRNPRRLSTDMSKHPVLIDSFLPGLPAELIRQRYAAAPGDEISSGAFQSSESSAALVANAFGPFLQYPQLLPPLPIGPPLDRPPVSVELEVENRFPWRGGMHPWLDVVIETEDLLIGIESKRYEPFRSKSKGAFSDAYWRPVWGEDMNGYCRVRDGIADGTFSFPRLDAVQLVKHAFGLRTAIHRSSNEAGKRAVLVYLYSEPESWATGRPVDPAAIANHRRDLEAFSEFIVSDEVAFRALSYGDLLHCWISAGSPEVRRHAELIRDVFRPC